MKHGGAKRTQPAGSTETPAKQLAGFVAKYDRAVSQLARAARSALRKRLPTAIELVYDNYQFLAIGFSAMERASDCLVSLAISSKGVALSFYYGSSLPDPDGLLLGSGNQHRYVRLDSPATCAVPTVEALIRAAIKCHAAVSAGGHVDLVAADFLLDSRVGLRELTAPVCTR